MTSDGLVAVAGDADHHRLVGRNRAALDERDRAGQRRAAGRLGEDALRSPPAASPTAGSPRRSPSSPCRRSRAASAARGSRRPGCRWQSTSRWCCGFTGSGNSAPAWNALTTGADPAACTACMRGRSPLTQPSVFSSSNARPMRGSSVPPATGQTTCAREAPAELLGDLEAVRLGAFGVVGAQVDVGEAPAVPIGDLRAQPVDVVVVALDGDHAGPVDGRAHHLGGFEVVGDEDVADRARAAPRAPRRCWPGCPSTRRRRPRSPAPRRARRPPRPRDPCTRTSGG